MASPKNCNIDYPIYHIDHHTKLRLHVTCISCCKTGIAIASQSKKQSRSCEGDAMATGNINSNI